MALIWSRIGQIVQNYLSTSYNVKFINPKKKKIEQRDAMFVHSHLARHCCQLIEPQMKHKLILAHLINFLSLENSSSQDRAHRKQTLEISMALACLVTSRWFLIG